MLRQTTWRFAVAVGIYVILLVIPRWMWAEDRSYDGSGNNIDHPLWGAANSQLRRIAAADYFDGIGNIVIESPQCANPRDASNMIAAQSTEIPNRDGLTNFVWQWDSSLIMISILRKTMRTTARPMCHYAVTIHWVRDRCPLPARISIPTRELAVTTLANKSTRFHLISMDRGSMARRTRGPSGCDPVSVAG